MELHIATNNGDIGGGEVMLLNLARAARSAGHRVTVIGPSSPGELIEAAQDEGFSVLALPAQNRQQYMVQLRTWAKRHREALLWCNGLVPAAATAGMKNRVVHLHQLPEGKNRFLAVLAKRGARRVFAPSRFAADRIKGAEPLHNWVAPVEAPLSRERFGQTVRVGFLGRPSVIKGTDILAEAIHRLNLSVSGRSFTLVLAGEAKFVDEESREKVGAALEKISGNTEQLGWVEPRELLNAVDLLAVPSNWNEVFGLVAAEAMSARVPLVVSDAGALPEVVGADYSWIARQGKVDPLVSAIKDLLDIEANHPDQLLDQTAALFWRWQENFSPQAGKARITQILTELEQE